MERKLVACGAVLALGLVAGCGSTGPLSRADFAKKANALCVHRRAVEQPLVARAHGDMRSALRASLPELEAFARQLAALKPPASLRGAYTEILALERHAVTGARELIAGRTPNLNDEGPPLHRHEALRLKLGMVACNG
jgi:predicted small lipoprotein YifL